MENQEPDQTYNHLVMQPKPVVEKFSVSDLNLQKMILTDYSKKIDPERKYKFNQKELKSQIEQLVKNEIKYIFKGMNNYNQIWLKIKNWIL